jgi:hypothetical protein
VASDNKTLLLLGLAGVAGYLIYTSSQDQKGKGGGSTGGTGKGTGTGGDSGTVKSIFDDIASFGKSAAGLFGGSGSSSGSSGMSTGQQRDVIHGEASSDYTPPAEDTSGISDYSIDDWGSGG